MILTKRLTLVLILITSPALAHDPKFSRACAMASLIKHNRCGDVTCEHAVIAARRHGCRIHSWGHGPLTPTYCFDFMRKRIPLEQLLVPSLGDVARVLILWSPPFGPPIRNEGSPDHLVNVRALDR